MAGVTRFTGIAEVQSIGKAELDQLTGAVDKFTGALDNMGKKAEGQQPVWNSFAAKIKEGIQNPLQAAGSAAESFLTSIGPVGTGISIAAAGFAVFAKTGFEAAKALGEYGDRISDTAIRLGMTGKEVGQFGFAMKRAGGDISSVEAAMRALSRGLASSDEEGKKARQVLEDMGIKARGARGELMPMAQLLPLISDSLRGMTDTANRNTAAINLFGRAGLELLPDLLELNEGLKRAKELNVGPSDEALERYKKYHENVAEIGAAWEKLKRTMAEPVAGYVNIIMGIVNAFPNATPDSHGGVGGRMGAGSAQPNDPLAAFYGEYDSLSTHRERIAGLDRGKAMQDRIRASWGMTKEGIEEALKSAKDDMLKARADALEAGLSDVEVTKRKAALDQIAGKVKNLEGRLEALKTKAFNPDPIIEAAGKMPNRQRFDLFPGLDTGTYAMWTPRYDAEAKESSEARTSQFKAIMEGSAAADKRNRERAAEYAKQELDHRIRIVELTAGPGGEVAAIEQIYRLRIAAAKTQEEAQRAENEHEERLLELRKKSVDEYKSLAESGFQSLLSGGRGGLSSFLLSQGTGIATKMVGNLAGMAYRPGMLSIPGQGTPENPNFLGKLLQGTPLGMDPAAGAQMSAATMQVQAAQMQIQAATAAASGGGGFFPSAAASKAIALFGGNGGNGPGFLGGWGGPSNPYVFYNNESGVDENSELESINAARSGGVPKWASTAGKGMALAAGGYGVYSGIRMGGGRGAMTAISSGLGAAAMLDPEPISKAVLTVAALATGLATTLFGDPKANRAKELENERNSRVFNGSTGTSYSTDLYGRSLDSDMMGRMRPIVIYDQRSYSAIDAPSFVEWGKANPAAIAEVTSNAIVQDEQISATMRSVTF